MGTTTVSCDTPADLLDLTPREFEAFLAELWGRRGWETRVLPPGRDAGVDVVGEQHDPYYRKLVIQAKRYQLGNKVGAPQVREYASLKRQEGADEVVVATTSEFTSGAIDLAEQLNVKLIDGETLVKMANDETVAAAAPESNSTDDVVEPLQDEDLAMRVQQSVGTIIVLAFVGIILWFLVQFALAAL